MLLLHAIVLTTVSILEENNGYTNKYIPLPEGAPEGKDKGNSSSQQERWGRVVASWIKGLQEGKEVVSMMDSNLDHLTWTEETDSQTVPV